MSLDPGTLTVRAAVKELAGLSDEELLAAYDAELDGRGRKSLLDEITAKRDELREEAVVAEEPAVVAEVVAPSVRYIDRPARRGLGAARYILIEKDG